MLKSTALCIAGEMGQILRKLNFRKSLQLLKDRGHNLLLQLLLNTVMNSIHIQNLLNILRRSQSTNSLQRHLKSILLMYNVSSIRCIIYFIMKNSLMLCSEAVIKQCNSSPNDESTAIYNSILQ